MIQTKRLTVDEKFKKRPASKEAGLLYHCFLIHFCKPLKHRGCLRSGACGERRKHRSSV